MAGAAGIALLLGAIASPADAGSHSETGVGSCTLKNWNPNQDPDDAKDLPNGDRPQSYKPDDYNCTGAKFAAPGTEFAKFPQPHDFKVNNQQTVRPVQVCQDSSCTEQLKNVLQPAATSNPLAPYFPPFTHFVILYRENHTFDD